MGCIHRENPRGDIVEGRQAFKRQRVNNGTIQAASVESAGHTPCGLSEREHAPGSGCLDHLPELHVGQSDGLRETTQLHFRSEYCQNHHCVPEAGGEPCNLGRTSAGTSLEMVTDYSASAECVLPGLRLGQECFRRSTEGGGKSAALLNDGVDHVIRRMPENAAQEMPGRVYRKDVKNDLLRHAGADARAQRRKTIGCCWPAEADAVQHRCTVRGSEQEGDLISGATFRSVDPVNQNQYLPFLCPTTEFLSATIQKASVSADNAFCGGVTGTRSVTPALFSLAFGGECPRIPATGVAEAPPATLPVPSQSDKWIVSTPATCAVMSNSCRSRVLPDPSAPWTTSSRNGNVGSSGASRNSRHSCNSKSRPVKRAHLARSERARGVSVGIETPDVSAMSRMASSALACLPSGRFDKSRSIVCRMGAGTEPSGQVTGAVRAWAMISRGVPEKGGVPVRSS